MGGLVVRGLCRSFGEVAVLDRVDLEVPRGEVVALVGANGAGKSTLLRCVVGSDRPDAGKILLDGKVLDERLVWARRAVAGVLDDLDFFADMSVREHLDMLSRAHGDSNPGAVIAEVLDVLALQRARDQLPGTLSSGQRRRLALATTMVRPMDLLVLDEPEQRLDIAGRQWLEGHLRAVAARGGAVLFASHDDELVRGSGARVVTMHAA